MKLCSLFSEEFTGVTNGVFFASENSSFGLSSGIVNRESFLTLIFFIFCLICGFSTGVFPHKFPILNNVPFT